MQLPRDRSQDWSQLASASGDNLHPSQYPVHNLPARCQGWAGVRPARQRPPRARLKRQGQEHKAVWLIACYMLGVRLQCGSEVLQPDGRGSAGLVLEQAKCRQAGAAGAEQLKFSSPASVASLAPAVPACSARAAPARLPRRKASLPVTSCMEMQDANATKQSTSCRHVLT